jgi:hypothetical protein
MFVFFGTPPPFCSECLALCCILSLTKLCTLSHLSHHSFIVHVVGNGKTMGLMLMITTTTQWVTISGSFSILRYNCFSDFPQKISKISWIYTRKKKKSPKQSQFFFWIIPIKHQLQSDIVIIEHFKTITQNILNEEQHDKFSHPQPGNTV